MNFNILSDLINRLTAWRIPGNAVSVWHEGKEIFTSSSGFSDFENHKPMTGKELLYIYSCSKVAAVTAALQLYERGFFLLDDPLYEYIPEFRDVTVKGKDGELRPAASPITLRHLFTMTSGLTYNTNTPAFAKARELTDGRMDTLTVIRCLAQDPLSFDPGTHWNYSLSHDVLAAVVEVISRKRFCDYVKENIFDPLGMKDSFYHDDSRLADMAAQYRFENSTESDLVKLQSGKSDTLGGRVVNVGKVNSLVFGPEYDSGGAGIITTVSDYGRFTSALSCGGLGSNGERILSSGTVELLRTNQLSAELLREFDWKQLRGYGYGLGVRTLIDRAASGSPGSLGEFGWGGAAGATVLVDPDLKLSMFYAHHMLNPQEEYYQPRIRNALYASFLS